ncbi:SAM-dependent DNA methyltransferase [Salinibacterium sp. dk2585]|uniref:type I restriction-modification system subunit M n=1 Tax=unclassified Salinibacterium TaxID=2632331 RepID=UPI0011C2490A|nr:MULTISPECIES: class I SAM-dependent DNA methyltransferase [unclassified Salinibacterium]QEE61505.1 SAM-dependent DNA methyltransferase [Salinibacterium sp. dk2585]TXK52526.1 SAM-dependent DNA methyltransferase [Salinibacterium sp. dk5596]
MVTGELKSQVDKVWNAFWSGGIANPMEVIEQITYLLFIKRLDELHTLAENKANTLGKSIENPVFPDGIDDSSGWPRPYSDLRWSHFKHFGAADMYKVVSQNVFPFIQGMGEAGSSFAVNMKDARFTIPTPALLVKVVELLENIPMQDRDTKGDVYEYMLSKLATSGQNGQFRTPRHIIQLMVDMAAPTPQDVIVDPAAGTAGFLLVAGEYVRGRHPELWADAALRQHFDRTMFTGFDSDAAMSRIGSMNMLLHGVENATMVRRDSLAEEHTEAVGKHTLVLANPPFAGSLDYDTTAKDLLAIVKTKKTELLFLALMLRLLKNGGRAAVIVPDGVLFGSSTAHRSLRRMLVEDHKLDAVIKLPSGAFKPYTGVSTAILFFTKTSSGGTNSVWFYDIKTDGFTLDDKRTPIDANDLPDVLARWQSLSAPGSPEAGRPRTAQSFLVPKDEIAANNYDLSLNRYKEVEHEHVEHRAPGEILADLSALEQKITDATAVLAETLK